MPRLSPKAHELVELLTETARSVAEQRGWGLATQVTLFCPQVAVAAALGVDPSTVRRWFYRYPALRERVAARPHFTSISAGAGRRTVVDGMLWTVRMGESRGDLRVPIEDLTFQGHRNLELDIVQGRVMHGSEKPTGLVDLGSKVKYLLGWVFGAPDLTPVGSSGDPCITEADTPEAVAVALAHALDDRHSLRYWIRESRRWAERGRLHTLRLQAERVLADRAEGFARRAAALLVSRLRPPCRTGGA